jgi:hypothetical protein
VTNGILSNLSWRNKEDWVELLEFGVFFVDGHFAALFAKLVELDFFGDVDLVSFA